MSRAQQEAVRVTRPYARGPWGPPYGYIMADLSEHSYAALRLGMRHGWTRAETSRLLNNLKRAGYVEHRGAWHITEAGRAAILRQGAEDDA